LLVVASDILFHDNGISRHYRRIISNTNY